jgi:hypothetical protein
MLIHYGLTILEGRNNIPGKSFLALSCATLGRGDAGKVN